MQTVHEDIFFDRENKRDDPALWTCTSENGIVVSAHYRASQAGVEILRQGGNAIDATVAVSVALGVVEPAASGLGGMVMMNIHLAEKKRTLIIEGPCRAPKNAAPEIVAAYPRKSGYKAVAVPTHPAVLTYVLNKYGTQSVYAVLQPAIRLAEEGVLMTPFQHRLLNSYASQLCEHNGAAFFLNEPGNAYAAGQCVRQPILASTLKRMAQHGFEEFYCGETGARIIKDMVANGGFISRKDFDPPPFPVESKPLCRSVLGWEVFTMPPPGGGLALLEMLLLYEKLKPLTFDPTSPETVLLFASIIHKARKDRATFRLELHKHGEAMYKLLEAGYIQHIAASLQAELTGAGETTHFNIIDRWGNIVACTQSIERSYGAKVVTPSLGFLYNGFMKGFKIKNKKHPHYLQPGAVARSNAAPTLVFAPNRVFAIGSTGSERLASGLFQVLIRLFHQDGFAAVSASRLHCTPQKHVQLEEERFSKAQRAALQQAGYHLAPYHGAWAFSAGGLHLACREKKHQWGVADPRRDGAALGV
ncbi:gamma-glutamyltransferase [candidate division KSB1 bacterium]|nr:gamma-glutamyltransferase [candidate division KSB1 bacterium]